MQVIYKGQHTRSTFTRSTLYRINYHIINAINFHQVNLTIYSCINYYPVYVCVHCTVIYIAIVI